MAPSSRHPALRIDIPTLEPGDVMLERLVAASAGSVPSPGTPWLVGLRTAVVAVVVALLGVTSWAAGALAGADTPFGHREIHHAAMVPTTPTGVAGSPQSGDSPSGSPAPTGLPDAASHSAKSHAARGTSTAHRHRQHAAGHAQPTTGNGPGPVTAGAWPGLGIGHHYGWGKSRGRHHSSGPASQRNH
ncbi:hypothetical protein [Nocardioides ultimimeridianus]